MSRSTASARLNLRAQRIRQGSDRDANDVGIIRVVELAVQPIPDRLASAVPMLRIGLRQLEDIH